MVLLLTFFPVNGYPQTRKLMQ